MACRHRPTFYDALFQSSKGKITSCRFCGESIKKPNIKPEEQRYTRDGCLPELLFWVVSSALSWCLLDDLRPGLNKVAYYLICWTILGLLRVEITGIYNYYFGHYVPADAPDLEPADQRAASPVDDPDGPK